MAKIKKGWNLLAGILAICFMLAMVGCGGGNTSQPKLQNKPFAELTKDDYMTVDHLTQFKASIPNMKASEQEKEALNFIADKYINRKDSCTLGQIYDEAKTRVQELNKKEQPPKEESPKDQATAHIKSKIKEYVGTHYANTNINSITVNEDLGTDKEDDYVVLVNLTWNVKNSGKTSKEMLDMYSSDMAARMYEDLPEAQELCIFWTVPYLNGKAKISFERANGGMKYTDKIFDAKFNK